MKSSTFFALALAAAASAPAFAADVGRVTWVGGSGSNQQPLPGQDGNVNTNSVYNLGTIGSVPPSIAGGFSLAQQALFVNGTDMTVSLDIPGASSFNDFIQFVIPSLSTTTTNNAAFNIQVFNSIISQFTAFSVDLYSGPASWSLLSSTPLNTLVYTAGQLTTTATGTFVNNLAPGTYSLYVAGNAIGNNPLYQIQVITSAIPEASTWLMLLAGLSAVGFVVKRRSV